jgi:1-phosphatidylinositol phosphodiesterase
MPIGQLTLLFDVEMTMIKNSTKRHAFACCVAQMVCWGLMCLLAGNAAWAVDRNAYDHGNHKTTASSRSWTSTHAKAKWMRSIPDAVNLGAVSMPGTHNSMARYNSAAEVQWGMTTPDSLSFGATQWMTLSQQLQVGVRYLDLRFRHINNGLQAHHGLIYQGRSAYQAFDEIRTFLLRNPSETVVVRVKEEYTPAGNSRSFAQTFAQLMSNYPGLFWSEAYAQRMPSMAAVRGKVVLLQDFSGTVGGRYLGMIYSRSAIQDQWDVPSIRSLPSKWSAIKSFAERANREVTPNPQQFYINYLSGAGTFMRPWMVASAQVFAYNGAPLIPGYTGTNYLFKDYLDQSRPRFVGIVPVDYPGWSLLAGVIATNQRFMAPPQKR